MNAKKLAAIAVIYIIAAAAWMVLGGVTMFRSEKTYSRLGQGYSEGESGTGRASVQELWGSPHVQLAPQVWTTHKEKRSTTTEKGKTVQVDVEKQDPVVLSKSRIKVNIELEPRQKGLLWYSTYRVKFAGDWGFGNEFPDQRTFSVKFMLPAGQAAFDNVLFYVNGKRTYPTGNLADGLTTSVVLKGGEKATLTMSYGSQGMDTWHYQFGKDETISSVRDFEANVTTNCGGIDFPGNCLSPTHKTPSGTGWDLLWKYGDLISGSKVGISLPHKLNPGPFAGRLALFAPVSLFFFFVVLLIFGAVGNVRLHPMHYLMLAGAFFSFHLLFSYAVDHVVLFCAFLISSAVSMLLTISYLRLVVNWKFAVLQGGLWQFVFLVLFAYAFFFEGYTGLTITIGAIVTLAVLMQVTGRVNWDEKLAAERPGSG
jgi:hypothetical protein